MTNDPMLGGPEPYQGQGAPAQPDASQQQYPQYPGGYVPAPPQYPSYTTPAYPGYYAGPMPQSTNGMAIASLVCSISGFVIFPVIGAVLGVIFGHIALKQIKVSQEQGHGMAVAGLVMGYIQIALSVLFILLFIVLIAVSSSTAQPTN